MLVNSGTVDSYILKAWFLNKRTQILALLWSAWFLSSNAWDLSKKSSIAVLEAKKLRPKTHISWHLLTCDNSAYMVWNEIKPMKNTSHFTVYFNIQIHKIYLELPRKCVNYSGSTLRQQEQFPRPPGAAVVTNHIYALMYVNNLSLD